MGVTVAVAGATGVVGREMLKVLEKRDFPVDALVPLASERSVGVKLPFRGGEVEVRKLSAHAFRGVDVALFSCGSGLSREFAPAAVKHGAVVVDNSSAFRMDDDVPLVVPEVNGDEAKKHKGVIANPNCSTIQMVVAVAPLHRHARIRRMIVSTYQAVSGAGAAALAELERQTPRVQAGEPAEPEAFPHQIAFNIIPHIGDFDDKGYSTEEMKMVNETRKILGDPDITVSNTCVRIPVFRAHSESVHLELDKPVSADQARTILSQAPGVVVMDDPSAGVYPMPWYISGKDEVFVGRIREDLTSPNGLEMWVVADQILKGAALNTVQIAETVLEIG